MPEFPAIFLVSSEGALSAHMSQEYFEIKLLALASNVRISKHMRAIFAKLCLLRRHKYERISEI
jgi:hypothetical protein